MASNSALESEVYDFVDEVPEKFKCSICTNVLRDSRLTECCGQHFCQKCLQSWFQTQTCTLRSCPHCRTSNFVHIHDKSVQREVNQLRICCSHHEERCQWVGELGDLQTHLSSNSGCGYEVVECPNRCKSKVQPQGWWVHQWTHSVQKLRRKDLQEHVTSQCPLRRYKCIHCGLEDTHKSITGSHHSKCPMFPLPCPNACGATEVKQCDMSTHRQQCPLEPVPCPNRCPKGSLERKDLKDHLTNECSLRKHTCQYCGREDTYQNISTVHNATCPDLPLECPNKCGATRIKRRNAATHRNKCPLESVQCPFQKAGCGAKLLRRNLGEHVTTETQQHLLLTFKKTCSLEEECSQLKKKNMQLERRCQALEMRNRELDKQCKKSAARSAVSYPKH